MLLKTLLLLAAAIASLTPSTATGRDHYPDNNAYNGMDQALYVQQQILQQQQQLQNQRLQQQQQEEAEERRPAALTPQINADWRLQQQQQQLQPQAEFDTFDVANLQRLQHLNEFYGRNNNERNGNNDNSDYSELLQRQQQPAQLNGNSDGSSNSNNRQQKHNINGETIFNGHAHKLDTDANAEAMEKAFRLQLSGLNEAAASHNNNNNNNDSNDNEKYNNNNNNNNAHMVSARNEGFAAGNPFSLATHRTDGAAAAHADIADAEELSMDLPYGIQNVRKRVVRGYPTLEHHSESTTYQSLCPTKRVSIPLETSGYEYRPRHYIEVTCAHNYAPTHSYDFNKNKICSEAGFSCIQLNRTIHLIRRNKAATVECWESEVRIVPSGCECMWPRHNLGDIVTFHDAQKRYTAPANERSNADRRQMPRQLQVYDADAQRQQAFATDNVGFEAYEVNY